MWRSFLLLAFLNFTLAQEEEEVPDCRLDTDLNELPVLVQGDNNYVSYRLVFKNGLVVSDTTVEDEVEVDYEGSVIIINLGCEMLENLNTDIVQYWYFSYSRSVEHCDLLANCSLIREVSVPVTVPEKVPEKVPITLTLTPVITKQAPVNNQREPLTGSSKKGLLGLLGLLGLIPLSIVCFVTVGGVIVLVVTCKKRSDGSTQVYSLPVTSTLTTVYPVTVDYAGYIYSHNPQVVV